METGCVEGGVFPGCSFQNKGVWAAMGPHPKTETVLTWCLTSAHTRTQLCLEELKGPRTPTVPSQSQGSRPSPQEQDKRARQTGAPGAGVGGVERGMQELRGSAPRGLGNT